MTARGRISKGLYWDRAWSLVEGCSPVSTGCLHCWSAQQAHMRQFQRNPRIKQRYMGLTNLTGRWTGRIRLMHSDLTKPLHIRKPTTWSVWNDLFHPDVPNEFILRVFDTIAMTPQHTYQILTKRPLLMLDFLTWWQVAPHHNTGAPRPLDNVHLGVSCENQATADERIPLLLQTPAAVRFVSVEPMLEPIQFYDKARRCVLGGCVRYAAGAPAKCPIGRCYAAEGKVPKGINWVICGSESGSGARPMDEDWVRSLKDQCVAAGVPFFYKQNVVDGKKVSCPTLDGKRYREMPEVNNATD